ncbi:Gfo/Idh/MocA family protein [Streptomyces hygroscopicus]|uniref:Gfo/Idh/MocA family protein n=1 Tax=Streptomyces hygroscopicus TaxID=1912 RepID=UPI00223F8F1A|nr:Gfo/Idh/MocA family oxidoreductase [Streptomyces hygroscopicus]
MINWGFIGAGSIARTSLAPAVHRAEGSALYAVACHSPDRASALGPKVVYRDYAGVVEDPSVHVVYICLHNSAHRHWALRALAAGKHVLCEKPLGLTAEETDEMAATAARHGRLLVEAAWNRWHPRTRDMEQFLAKGMIGEVREVIAEFHGAVPAKDNYRWNPSLGGGALFDVGCYAISAALGAFSWQQPHVSRAALSAHRPGQADARADIVLAFRDGVAQVSAAFTNQERQHLEIRGTEGWIRARDDAFTAGAQPVDLQVNSSGMTASHVYPAVDSYQLMVAEVSSAAAGEPAHLVPLEQSLAVAVALDHIRQTASVDVLPLGQRRPAGDADADSWKGSGA